MAIIILVYPILIFIPFVALWRNVWLWGNGIGILFVGLGLLVFVSPPAGGPHGAESQEIIETLYFYIVLPILAAFIVRLVVHSAKYGDVAVGEWPWLLCFGNGFTAAAVLSAAMIGETAGSPDAIMIHLSLVGLSLFVAGIGVFFWKTWVMGLAAGLVALTLFSATYPYQVKAAAIRAADGAPYCIFQSQRQKFAERTRDMTFLTFDKTARYAHAVLIIETPYGQRYGNWSYAKGRFMVPWDVWIREPNLQCPQ